MDNMATSRPMDRGRLIEVTCGKQISDFCTMRHVSKVALSESTGISLSALKRIMSSSISPTLTQLSAIAESLSITVQDLLHSHPVDYALTGSNILDDLVIQATHLRSNRCSQSERESLYGQIHVPGKSYCYSPHYTQYVTSPNYSGRPPSLKNTDSSSTQSPRKIGEFVFEFKRTNDSIDINVHQHPSTPGLIGIPMEEEVECNDTSLESGMSYTPVNLFISGPWGLQATVQGVSDKNGAVWHTVENYELTSSVKTVLNGGVKPRIRSKTWRNLPHYFGGADTEEKRRAVMLASHFHNRAKANAK